MSQENNSLALRSLNKEGFDEGNRGVKGELIPQTQCMHRLLSVVPIVPFRVEGGYAARCLLCGVVGPVRGSGPTARAALLEWETRSEE